MAIKKKIPENNYNTVPVNGDLSDAPEYESYTPPHSPSMEVMANIEKNMDMTIKILEAIKETPMNAAEAQKFINDHFEKPFVQLTGKASNAELHFSSK